MPVLLVTARPPITRGSPPGDTPIAGRGGAAPLLVVVDSPAAELLADLPGLILDRFLLVAIPFPRPGGAVQLAAHWCAAGRIGAHRAAVTAAVDGVLAPFTGRYRVLELRFRTSADPSERQRRLWAGARSLAARHHADLLTGQPAGRLHPGDGRPGR